MITSMTGFANKTVTILEREGEHCALDIEIKTFNAKFCEPAVKLPGVLSACEMDVVQRLKARLHRGRIYCTIRVGSYGTLLEKMVFSPTRVHDYLDAVAQLREKHGLHGDVDMQTMVSLPNLFTTEKAQLPPEAIGVFLAGIDEAIDQVLKARAQEGKSMLVDIQARMANCKKLIARIAKETKKLMEAYKEGLGELQQKANEGDGEAKTLLIEKYAVLDKMDVHEEIVRFESHLAAVKQHLESDAREKGRRLDFIFQELMREINTIMAKCSSYTISADAVDVKVELEKAREQIQNIV